MRKKIWGMDEVVAVTWHNLECSNSLAWDLGPGTKSRNNVSTSLARAFYSFSTYVPIEYSILD